MDFDYQYMQLNRPSTTPRRVGLSRTGTPLLQKGSWKSKEEVVLSNMPAKTTLLKGKDKASAAMSERSRSRLNSQKEAKSEDDDLSLFKMPESSSSESESEVRGTIKPSLLKSGNEKPLSSKTTNHDIRKSKAASRGHIKPT